MNRVEQTEVALFGAYVASAEVRQEITSDDFTVPRIRLAVKDIEKFEAGEIKKEGMVYLLALMDSLRLPHGVKFIDGLVAVVKSNTRSKRAREAAAYGWLAKTPQHIESFKQKVSEL